MPKLVALTTTGTALLTNTNIFKNNKYENILDIPDKDIEEFIRYNIEKNTETRISAEVNSTLQLDKYLKDKENKKIDIVHLIFSDTEEMKKQKDFLIKYFEKKGFEVAHTIISKLTYKEKQFKMEGLRSFINELTKLIDNYKTKQYEVVMNATGGFKAEIAYATVLSQLRHIETFYIYEKFNEIIPLPYLPLNLDVEYWSKYENIFEKFEKGVLDKECDKILSYVPQGFRFLIEKKEDNKWYLNPAGEAFYLSFLGEKEVYLNSINEKMVFTKNRDTTLWDKVKNISVRQLNDIPDKEVKQLLRRILRFHFVRKIELVDYHKVGVSQGKTYLEYKTKHPDKKPNYVQYEIKCKDGKQSINIVVDEGFCDELIFMLGKKVYP